MTDLQSEIANALYWDLAIPRHCVTARVDGGLVILQGVVERKYQKSCAEAIARRAPSVIDVRNEIIVQVEHRSA